MSYEEFSKKQQDTEVNEAYAEAHRAAKLGKKLTKKVVKMADKGRTSRRVIVPSLHEIEYRSTSLALNAELKEQGIDIDAELVQKYQGSLSDYSAANFVEINKIDGRMVDKKDVNGAWRR